MAIRRRLGTRFVEQEPPPDPYKTAEEMEEHCCVPTPKVQCYERYIGPISPDIEEAMKNAGIAPRTDGVYDGTGTKNGRLTRVAWRPRKNPCGKVIERVKMDPKNCCDEVEPLAIDRGSSAQVLAPGTHGNVYFSGGKFPVLVRVRGNGFTLDGYNQRDGWVDGPGRGFTIFAHEFACGSCPITISDGCTTASYTLRATVGHWDGWCVTYRWQRPRIRSVRNRNVFSVRYDSDRCTYTDYISASGYTGMIEDRDPYAGGSINLVQFFRWEGGWAVHANSRGNAMIQDPDLLPGEFDKVIAHCEGLGIPHDTHPNDYAPNGPADIYSVCSAPAYPCRFIC